VPAYAVERAFHHGVNYLYWGSIRRSGFGEAMRNLSCQRDRIVLVLQSYSRLATLLGWSVERALRSLRLEYANVLLLGMWNHGIPERILDGARALRERKLVRFLAVSSHNRRFAAELACRSDIDVVHCRYIAAHPRAEVDIFPKLPVGRAGMVSFTATSWGSWSTPPGFLRSNVFRVHQTATASC
jgi:hypothetical protein